MFFFGKQKIKIKILSIFNSGCFRRWEKYVAVLLIVALLTPLFATPVHALFGYGESSTVPDVVRERLVSFLVEEDLLDNSKLKNKIENYAVRVQEKVNGKVILIPIPADASPLDIYEGNAHLYFSGKDSDGHSQLIGTILIGDVPLPIVDKGGNLWPTIFPYVDFEDPVYEWDYQRERFVFRGGDTHQAEVWHGVLRSDSRQEEGWSAPSFQKIRKEELVEFLNEQGNWGDARWSDDQIDELFDFINQEDGWDGDEMKDFMKEKLEDFIKGESSEINTDNDSSVEGISDSSGSGGMEGLEIDDLLDFIEDASGSPDAGKLEEAREAELVDFLETNEEVAEGDVTFDSNVFSADLANETSTSLGEIPMQQYEIWINNIEDIAYNRYTKHWAKEVMEELDTEHVIDVNIIDSSMRPPSVGQSTDDLMKNVPDVHTKLVIESSMKRYYEVWKNKLSIDNGKMESSGRWNAEDAESTIVLISQKDEQSAVNLKEFNDSLENALNAALVANEVAGKIKVKTTKEIDIDYSTPAPMTQTREKDMYWNGVLRADMTASDCSILRGTPRTSSYPHAQMVKANRSYNPDTKEEDYPTAADPEQICENRRPPDASIHDWSAGSFWWISDDDEDTIPNFIDTALDVYEGCCAVNTEMLEESLEFVNDYCETGSEWVIRDYRGAGSSTPYPPEENDNPTLTNQYREHVGATAPLFDITATKEVLSGFSGAQGCDSILDRAGDLEISSLVYHNEPTDATISAQMENMGSIAMPVDKPRGFSFYDSGWAFHRLNYFNVFAFIGRHKEVPESARKSILKSEILAEMQTIIANTNAVSSGGSVPGSVFSAYTGNLDTIAESIMWLDTDIEEKNKLVLNVALSPVGEARDFLMDEDFHDGYELAQIVANAEEGGGGMQMGFEQGSSSSSAQFQDAQMAAAGFSFDDGSATSNIEKEEENHFDFSGQKTMQESCNGKNIITWFPCFFKWMTSLPTLILEEFVVLPDSPKPPKEEAAPPPPPSSSSSSSSSSGASSVSSSSAVPSSPPSGAAPEKPEILTPEESKDSEFHNTVSKVKVSEPAIHVGAGKGDPVILEIDLQNKASSTVQSAETPVTLSFDNSNAEKFFDIFPSSEAMPIGGKAVFTLFPKETNVGGNFELSVELGGKVLETIPVTVSKYSLSTVLEERQVVVDDKKGLSVQVKVEAPDGMISTEKDKSILLFRSAWGTFANGGRATVTNGRAETIFFPGKRAGEASIFLTDSAGQLPPVEQEITILPGDIDHVVLNSSTDVLVAGADFTSITAQLQDEFGNDIFDTSGTFRWETENILVDGVEEVSVFTTPIKKGKTTLFIRPKYPLPSAQLRVTIKLPLEEITVLKKFSVPAAAVFSIESSAESVTAGSTEPIEILINAETGAGERLEKNIEINVLGTPKGVGQFLDTISLKDGLGKFKFFAGTTSGEVKLSFTSPGFETQYTTFTVDPDKGVKILATPSSSVMDVDDIHAEINLDISVVDQFGNIDTTFTGNVALRPNQPNIQLSTDREALIEMSVFDEASGAQLVIEQDAAASREAGTSPDTTLLDVEGTWSVSLVEGQVSVEITPGSGSTGPVLMSVEAPGLVPDTLEFAVTNLLTADEIEDLGPKSLFALLMGFDSGELLSGKSIGSRYLFSGESQAVGTLLVPPNPNKRLGYLSPSGEMASELTAEVMTGNVFTVDILKKTRSLAEVQVHFQNNPEFFITREQGTAPGVYFIPEEEFVSVLTKEDQTILWGESPMLTLALQGGIQLDMGGVEFLPQPRSFLEWQVVFRNDILGTIVVVPASPKMKSFDDKNPIPEDAEGVFLRAKVLDIHVQESFTGKTTNDERGIAFVDPNKKEFDGRKLGAPYLSAENVQDDGDILWTKSWKPAAKFAAGNTAGESAQWNGSDAFLLLGDPTASTASANSASSSGIPSGIGKPIWKSPMGPIEQILVADINGDNVPDILNRVGNRLFALYQENSEIDNFRDTGPIIRFGDGVKKVIIIDNDNDGFDDVLQLNAAGKLVFHRNTNGTFAREKATIEGYDGVIHEMYVGNINDDEQKGDLIFSDSNKTLFVAMGTSDGKFFSPLQIVAELAPTLDETTENYSAPAEQDLDELQYFDPEKFPGLSVISVSCDDMEDQITDITPATAVREETSIELLPENAFERNLGEGDIHFNFGQVPVTEETLDDITSSLQGGEKEMEEQLKAVAEKVLGDSAGLLKRTFIEVPYQTCVDATWGLSPVGGDPQMAVGDRLHGTVTFTPKESSESFEFLMPYIEGMQMVPGSLTCEDCDERGDSPDDVSVWGYSTKPFSSRGSFTFEWDMEVADLGSLEFQVFDAQGNDGIDDIVVGWEQDGKKQVIQFPSGQQNAGTPALADSQSITDVTMPTDPEPPAQDSLTNAYKADSNANGLPDAYDTFGAPINFSSLTCSSGCGLPVPSFVIPPFAPGSQSLYVPWLALKIPAFPAPLPAFSASTVPPWIFPFTPRGGVGSFFRIYTMPTTTARIGIGFCVGPYAVGMKTQYPAGNCLVVFPPLLEMLGVCSSNNSEAGTRQDSIQNMIENYNPAEYKPKFKFKSNIAIHPTEIVSDWIDQQKDEWNNIKLPTPKLLKPKMQKSEPELTEEELADPLFAENTKVLGRSLWKQLDRKSWITIKPELHTFPYPVFPQPDENGNNKELADFKTQWQAWKDAPGKYSKEKKKQQALYNENCKGVSNPPADCERWNQNIVSLDKLKSSAAENVQAIEKNWEAIESYKEVPKMLRKLFKDEEDEEGDMTRLGKQFKKYSDETEIYTSEWLDANKRAIEKWKKFDDDIREFFKGFEIVFEAFTGFTDKCPTCSVERGSSTTFLINLLLGSVKLPVIPAPRLPNILLDFSRVDISVQLPVPEIELQPVEMGYPNIPPPPSVDIPSISPGIPVIPILPKMPEIKIEVNIPEFRIPVLPILLDPPGLPKVFVKIRVVTKFLQKFLDLFCLIVQGYIPVPEWYVAGHVQQLTNRTKLFNIDFTFPSFSPNAPQFPDIDDIAIVTEIDIKLPTLVFEVLNETFKKFAELDQCIVDSMSDVLNGAPEAPPCPGGASVFVPSTVAHKEPTIKIVANMESDYFENQSVGNEATMFAALEKSFALSVNIIKTAFIQPKKNVFSTIASKDVSRWLTSVVDVGAIPTEAPTDFDVVAFQKEQTQAFEQIPSIYYFDPATGESEKITDFPLGEVLAWEFADLGKDYEDEILYAIGDELYLKYRVVPTIDENDLEKKYEQKHDGDYEDRFGKLVEWDYETFQEKFAPAKNVVDFVEQSGTTFQFEQIFNGTHYFEWVVSDRPDFVFEVLEDSDDRKSFQWERNGFLVRPHPKQYEIRPMSSQIQDIKGDPIVYAAPAQIIPKFKQSDCDDPKKIKPFFPTESLLIGIADYSRMEVRVPPIPGRPEQIEEKVLHKGEEAIVEYGEVCLTRGEVEQISMEKTELIDPRENTYFPSGARMELGKNDQVKIKFFDDREVMIHEYEKYKLHIFETEAAMIRAFERLEQKNQYGFFQGFMKDGDSLFFQKYLHDPQKALDFESPEIHVVGGTRVSAQLFSPVAIDASRTRDGEGTITEAWWDLYPAYDTDKDGDASNDHDFPTNDTMTAREVLKISLPPYESEGESSVILHVVDENGNHSQETITIKVSSSTPEIQEATARGGSILGSVSDAQRGVPITVERNRWGEWEPIRGEVLTDGGGDFSLTGLNRSGGIEITDFSQKESFEILENGRPILLNNLYDIAAQGADQTRPTSILLRDEQKTPVTAIAFSLPGTEAVVLDTDTLQFTTVPSVHVLDRDQTDNIAFRETTEGNVLISIDTQPLALIDKRGDFYGALPLGIRSEKEETSPVVFEIFNLDGEVIGEFVINLDKESEIRVTRQKKQGVRVDSRL